MWNSTRKGALAENRGVNFLFFWFRSERMRPTSFTTIARQSDRWNLRSRLAAHRAGSSKQSKGRGPTLFLFFPRGPCKYHTAHILDIYGDINRSGQILESIDASPSVYWFLALLESSQWWSWTSVIAIVIGEKKESFHVPFSIFVFASLFVLLEPQGSSKWIAPRLASRQKKRSFMFADVCVSMLVQNILEQKENSNHLWGYPGFPSLSHYTQVSYIHSVFRSWDCLWGSPLVYASRDPESTILFFLNLYGFDVLLIWAKGFDRIKRSLENI